MEGRRAERRLATVWLRDMDAVERQVTLPVDLEEAWELSPAPTTWPRWLGAEVVARPHARGGRPGRRPRRHRAAAGGRRGRAGRRLAWRWWSDDDARASQPGGDHPRARRGRHRGARRGGAASAPTPVGPGAGPARRGRTASSTSRRSSSSPPPSGGEPRRDRRDADARAGAVFEALADRHPPRVLRDVAEPRAAHRHRAGRRAAGQPPGRRQAPRRAPRRRARAPTSATGREARFTATLGPLAEAEGWLEPPARPGTTAWPRLRDSRARRERDGAARARMIGARCGGS